jgi:PAS domain S-box-containing protein
MTIEPPSIDELKQQLLDAQETIRALRAERGYAHTEMAMRETERGLLRERALLRALIDSIPDLIFFKDRESRYLGCNKAFEPSSRRLEHTLIGETDHYVSTPAIAEQYRAEDREVLSTGVALRVEEWVTTESGERRLFDTLKTPYHGPDGEVRGLIGVSRDITYRTLSEQALRESEERYRTLVENLDDAVFATTAEVRFSYVSAAIAKFGVTPDQLLGESLLRFVHPDDVDEAARRFARALDGHNEPYEFRLVDARGKLRYVRSSTRTAFE